MKILFLTMGKFNSIESHSIYADLLRCFRNHGHDIYIITPYEKRTGKNTELVQEKNTFILHVKTGNVTETSNLISKGVAQIFIEIIYIKAIKKFFSDVKFDLIIYSTPPITLASVIEYVKKRDRAKAYLLLKDIFPQNAVDIGMISTIGVQGFIYKYFRKQEKKLYKVSDYIGCMSPANAKYILDHNPEIDPMVVEVCPNSIEVIDKSVSEEMRKAVRKKYNIPLDKKVFIYGGNLGKPQGISFLIECLRKCEDIQNVFFLIVGDGTEYHLLHEYIENKKPVNVKLMNKLSGEAYDTLVGACDVGLIFLDYRFTIPNFPSRLLAYMQAKLPVLAVTDLNTDIGKIIVDGRFGWWCESNNAEKVKKLLSLILKDCLRTKGENGYRYLKNHFSVSVSYEIIFKKMGDIYENIIN